MIDSIPAVMCSLRSDIDVATFKRVRADIARELSPISLHFRTDPSRTIEVCGVHTVMSEKLERIDVLIDGTQFATKGEEEVTKIYSLMRKYFPAASFELRIRKEASPRWHYNANSGTAVSWHPD